MNGVIDSVLSSVPHWAFYVAAFALPFLEAAIMLGFVLPGEAAVVLGGVLAGRGELSLSLVLAVAVAGAILGDSVGYAVGRRYGAWIQGSRVGRRLGADRWRRGEELLRRRGSAAVFLGRFTALLRALVPGAAGMAELPYRRFLVFNVLGGVTWAVACVVGGWAIGAVIGTYLSWVGYAVVALAVVAVLVHHVRTHHVRSRA